MISRHGEWIGDERNEPRDEHEHDAPHEMVNVEIAARDAPGPPRHLGRPHQPRARANEQERAEERDEREQGRTRVRRPWVGVAERDVDLDCCEHWPILPGTGAAVPGGASTSPRANSAMAGDASTCDSFRPATTDAKTSDSPPTTRRCRAPGDHGASRDRTGDLRVANATLSQLSYGPARARVRPARPLSPTSIDLCARLACPARMRVGGRDQTRWSTTEPPPRPKKRRPRTPATRRAPTSRPARRT